MDQETVTKEIIQLKVDVSVMREQIHAITLLCQKMDIIIDKLVSNQDRLSDQIYADMDRRRDELRNEINSMSDRMMDGFAAFGKRFDEHEKMEFDYQRKSIYEMEQLKKWKFYFLGGAVTLAWLFSHLDIDKIVHFFKG